jgi:RNA polymerase sigma-70 factor (ECF subfamily)
MGASTGSTAGPDGELLWRARRRRDRAAYQELVHRHEQALGAYLAARTRDPTETADLLQEVYLRVLTARSRLPRDQASLRPYLLRVAAAALIDRHRRERVRRALPGAALAAVAAPEPDPLETVTHRETVASLRAALAQLPEAEAEVVRLHVYGELPLRQVARVMETPEGTAMSRMRRALARLRQVLMPVGGV